MTKLSQDVQAVIQTTLTLIFKITDGDGTPVNLTGATAAVWRLRSYSFSDENLISKTLVSGIAIQDGDATKDWVYVTLDPDDSASVTKGKWYHELRITDAEGNEFVPAIGEFEYLNTVTA